MIRLKIKQILQEKNKTAYWLSKQTGISANNIGKICNGETTNIRFDTMEKICKVLNCTPNELMETDDPQLNRLITYATYLTSTKDDTK
nr:MAG TPA: Cro/C1-type HTH DNA-binding domain protein [Caudoviricetes sp.]